MVSNEKNAERRRRGKTNVFDDDCGVWNGKASHNKYPYVVQDGSLKRVFFIVGSQQYCQEGRSEGKRQYVPLEPQPLPDQVITLVRYVVTLAANKQYKRKITWLAKESDGQGEVAVVEYLGEHVTGAPHGLCKDMSGSEPYVRTSITSSSNTQNGARGSSPTSSRSSES